MRSVRRSKGKAVMEEPQLNVGRLMIDGSSAYQVDYSIEETGRGTMRGDLVMLMSAYLSHSIELADANGQITKVVIDSIGDDSGPTTFHVRGEAGVEVPVE